MTRSRRASAVAVVVSLAAVPAVIALGSAGAVSVDPEPTFARLDVDTTRTDPTFTRIDVDTAIEGASFTSVGEVFAGEQDIVTSGYGVLDAAGRPTTGGSLQIYRPGATLEDWEKISIFGPEDGIIFPNATTISDMDGDGDADIILPSGYFFGTDPKATSQLPDTGAITWWENNGPTGEFERHDIVTGQAGSYHGVQHVDFDGDGILDIVSVSEEAREAGGLTDDTVQTQFFKGNADLTFAAPVTISEFGGSQPVVHDVDGDDDLDVISSQYFHVFNEQATSAAFLWLENSDTDGTLAASDFTKRTVAFFKDNGTNRGLGMGFQIRPVPNFREPGTISWVGTNHVNRCTLGAVGLTVREQVVEFTPTSDIRAPWELTTLSDPATPPPACPADYRNYPELEYSDAITARFGFGQGAPGVVGYGDVDGDADLDLIVSGDADRRLWWIEQAADGGTILHRLTGPGEYFGQAGGATAADFDGDGVNELVFSSYDVDTLAIWTPTGTVDAPVTVASKLSVTPAKVKFAAGTKTKWTLKLTAAELGPKRVVSVTFDATKGKDLDLGTVRLGPAGSPALKGTFTWRPKTAGTLVFEYAGVTVSDLLSDTSASDTAKITIKK